MSNILVDADACPVISIIEQVSQEYQIKATYVCDTAHEMNNVNNEVIIVDQGSDSADYKILELCHQDSIVITQDYALAGLCLTKNALVIHFNGFEITNNNIDALLTSRYLNQKARKSKTKTINPKKRTIELDEAFYTTLIEILQNKDK
ncbi:DUF188 domain-containing protein [Erysipelotrichaceae bacterium OttesenSCG-928-M19]|nr:DUF188 domain-containing protein [Erysipelotrichaceae bacterium OttesenSCG-928-M19]